MHSPGTSWAKKIESKPTAKGGGSVSCERIQRYCMQSSHLQVSIPRMHLCGAACLSPMQRAPLLRSRVNGGELGGKTTEGRKIRGWLYQPAPGILFAKSRSETHASEWMRGRAYTSSVQEEIRKFRDYEWRFPLHQKRIRKRRIMFNKRPERKIVMPLEQNYEKRLRKLIPERDVSRFAYVYRLLTFITQS